MQNNLLEKISKKKLMQIQEITADEEKQLQNQQLAVTYTNFNSQTGCLNWNLYNLTGELKYVMLYRGTPYVTPYYFLNAFTEVYLASDIVEILNSETLSDNYPYKVAILNNQNYVGVFTIPPKNKIVLEECGFSENNLPNVYKLYEVKLQNINHYYVIYNPLEIVEYSAETGILPPNPPFLIYEINAYNVKNTNAPYGFITQRAIIKDNIAIKILKMLIKLGK